MNRKSAPLTVLVTGAFGNIGRHVVRELLGRGHRVRALDRRTRATARDAARIGKGVDVLWGDIRDAAAVASAAGGINAAVHLAFLLPPGSEAAGAREVNVEGTRHLIRAMESGSPGASLVLSSTYALYGDTRSLEGLVRADTPVSPMNNYTRHKLEAEEMLKRSKLRWCIMRLAATMSAEMMLRTRIDPLIFDLPHDCRQEFVHCDDVARAVAACIEGDSGWGKTLLIGGGPECRFMYIDMINRSLGAMGIAPLPPEAFSREARQGGGWLDTSESQALLDYQRWTFQENLEDLARKAGIRRTLARALSPLIRRVILRRSPFYRRNGAG